MDHNDALQLTAGHRAAQRILLGLLAVGLVAGVATAFLAPDFYELTLSAEDGPLEWITALSLFFASCVCWFRAFSRRHKGPRFVAITTFAAIVLLFGAGEEISWGQRVFGWASGEFWQQNNDQAETNLHNLMVGDVKVNKLLFGVTLTFAFVIYFIALPLVSRRFSAIRALANAWYIPIARLRETALFVVSLSAMSILPAGRAPELGEYALGLLIALVVLVPVNRGDIL